MISLEWVKDYIDISDQDLEELAVKVTESGINVEKVITNHIDNLVIGEVKSVKRVVKPRIAVRQVQFTSVQSLSRVCLFETP